MPTSVITNPAGANVPPGVLYTEHRYDNWALDPAITLTTLTNLVPATIATNLTTPGLGIGAAVEMQSWNGATSGAASAPTHPTVALSATTVDNKLIGVIAGTTVGGQPVTAVGQTVQVVTYGIAMVIVDNTTVFGHALVQSTGTAGALHDTASVVAGQTMGFVLQALTVSSGLGLVLAFIKPQ